MQEITLEHMKHAKRACLRLMSPDADQPSADGCGVEIVDGEQYVVIGNNYPLLAAYAVTDSEKLERVTDEALLARIEGGGHRV